MRDPDRSAVWPSRLRWRLRGALQWPLFALLTVVDAILLCLLPISGTGPGFASALLLAMFFNLVAIATLGRIVALRVCRRRPTMPRVVAEDRAGVALLCDVTALLVLAGILHATRAGDAERAVRAQRDAVRAFVLAHGSPAHRANLAAMDTEQHAEDFFRTCVPDDPAADVSPLCLLVDTGSDHPVVDVDRVRSPNRHL